MKLEDFNDLAGAEFTECLNILYRKGSKYHRLGNDRLESFKKGGDHLNCTPEYALLGMMNKQIVTLYDFIDRVGHGLCPSEKAWNEILRDIPNYCVLLKGLLMDRWAVEAQLRRSEETSHGSDECSDMPEVQANDGSRD